MKTDNLKDWIKPYGDTLNDGVVQLSFTLPIEYGPRAKKAAEKYCEMLNFTSVQIAHSKKIATGFTYFVAFGRATPLLDYSEIESSEPKFKELSFYEINKLIKEKIGRKLVVVGATIGSDAHTVGIDAIMNMKGYNADYGLERYSEISAHNLGAQVPSSELLDYALKEKADVILVSQTVTQKDAHIHNFTHFIELCEAESVRNRFILIAGGPRITHDLAIELGYEAGFGPGTVPSQVASFFVQKIIERT